MGLLEGQLLSAGVKWAIVDRWKTVDCQLVSQHSQNNVKKGGWRKSLTQHPYENHSIFCLPILPQAQPFYTVDHIGMLIYEILKIIRVAVIAVLFFHFHLIQLRRVALQPELFYKGPST